MKKLLLVSIAILTLGFSTSFACDCEKGKEASNFEQLKKLVGTWEGTTNEGGKEQKAKMTYELTSGDSILIERIFVGTPHEMVSIYSNNPKGITMTHYCMLGNQPKMTLKNSKENEMFFEMKGTEGISSKKEEHMHSIELVWNGNDQLTQNWTNFKDGKKNGTATFNWKRSSVASK